MTTPTLELTYADVAALCADLEANLRKGRAFVAGASGVAERSPCTLVIVHPGTGARHSLAAEAVYVKIDDPGRGVGVQLSSFDAAALDALRAFVDAPPEAAAEATDDDDETAGVERAAVRTIQERVRSLTQPEQQRLARNGTLPERVALERTFGSSVWESLLGNTRISIPEVARIAKKGTLPKPLVETIAANAAWVGAPEVQRALLANPRSSGAVVTRVLRALSRPDLVRAVQQTAYPMAVRQAAKKMLGDG